MISYERRISVCLATYNGARFVRQQLRSILEQLDSRDELIVVDDASSDETVAVIISELTKWSINCRILVSERTLGPMRAFELAVRESSGRFVFLSDQDDVWLPNKVNVMLEALRSSDVVMSDAIVTDQDLRETNSSFYSIRKSRSGLLANFWKCRYVGCCMAMRREIAQLALPIPKGVYMHDVWFGLVAECVGETEFVKNRLILYRRHAGTATATTADGKNLTVAILKSRMLLAAALVRLLLIRVPARALRSLPLVSKYVSPS